MFLRILRDYEYLLHIIVNCMLISVLVPEATASKR